MKKMNKMSKKGRTLTQVFESMEGSEIKPGEVGKCFCQARDFFCVPEREELMLSHLNGDTPDWISRAIESGVIDPKVNENGAGIMRFQTGSASVDLRPGSFLVRFSTGQVVIYKPEVFKKAYPLALTGMALLAYDIDRLSV